MADYVKIDMQSWVDTLDDRRREWDDGNHCEIPDCVWNYVIELLKECGGLDDPALNDPKYIVDNLLVNGEYGNFDDCKKNGETDEEFIDRIEDKAIAVFPEERIVLFNFGF